MKTPAFRSLLMGASGASRRTCRSALQGTEPIILGRDGLCVDSVRRKCREAGPCCAVGQDAGRVVPPWLSPSILLNGGRSQVIHKPSTWLCPHCDPGGDGTHRSARTVVPPSALAKSAAYLRYDDPQDTLSIFWSANRSRDPPVRLATSLPVRPTPHLEYGAVWDRQGNAPYASMVYIF